MTERDGGCGGGIVDIPLIVARRRPDPPAHRVARRAYNYGRRRLLSICMGLHRPLRPK